MGSRELLKDFLLDFPTRLAKFEQNAIETGLDIQVSLTEIHIIDRIGPEGSQKMNIVAKKLGVTQATLTVACDRLESKGLIERRRDPEDKRAVIVRLTPSGLVAYSFHQALMDDLADAVISGMTPSELATLEAKICEMYDRLER